MSISYKPLKLLLVERDMNINQLEKRRGGIINEGTVSKLRNNKPVNLTTVDEICRYLDVPIEEVVEVIRD